MQILADRIIADAAEAFSAFGEVSLFDGRELHSANLKRADVLLVRSVTKIDAGLLNASPVKFVGTATAGIDHINLQSLKDANIEFASAPGCNANAVAEFIATSIITFCANENLTAQDTRVAIIGHGAVGSRVEHKLQILGFECLVNDPPKALDNPDTAYVSLDCALQAHIVTVHTPLTQEGDHPTRGLIGAANVSNMSNCRLLINAARGGIVDESALLERLCEDSTFNVQLDCWENEPGINRELLGKTFRASPHVAGHSVDARRNATAMLVDSLSRWSGIDTNWQARKPSPGDEILNDEIDLLSSDSTARNAFPAFAQLFGQCCPVNEINAAMRTLLSLPTGETSAAFDRLRQQFAARREFAFYKLPIERSGWHTQQSLPDLGFRLT